jgi:hypothetical protein
MKGFPVVDWVCEQWKGVCKAKFIMSDMVVAVFSGNRTYKPIELQERNDMVSRISTCNQRCIRSRFLGPRIQCMVASTFIIFIGPKG